MTRHLGWAALGGLAAFTVIMIVGTPALAGGTEEPPAAPAAADEEKPYKIVDGKVDFGTYNGFRRYHSECHVCHGPAGDGSSYAPSLTESLKTLSYEDFISVVMNGRERMVGDTAFVMPSFADNPNVVPYLDDIYAYLKARADGVIGRARPPHLPKPKD